MEAEVLRLAGGGIAPTVEAGKCICKWLKRKYRYVKHISQNFEELELANTRLCDAETRVRNELDHNRSKKEITPECRTWLRRVGVIRVDIANLRHEYENKPSTCLCGLWPFCTLLKLGKRIVKKTEEAKNLRNEQFPVMDDKPPTVHRSHKWSNDVRIVKHPSLENHMETLIDWLKEERFKRICIWGPPGVGKTTIMKTVHDNLCESRQFQYSFFVTLKEESRILADIQEAIWSGLGMETDKNNNPAITGAVISERLKDRKYVLFLDEVSSEINLQEVGINYTHNYGKVVFACRDKYIGHTDEDLNVKRLSNEDASKLFWEQVGDSDIEKKRDIKRIAEEIIKLCGGMPPILVLMGKHLAGENDVALWRDMKLQLQSPSEKEWKEWEEYYRSFKLVYDELDGHYKPCLLYWALFPSGEEINEDYVIDCWTAEQLFEWERLWRARDRGHAVLGEFMKRCLLEKGEKLGHFKMFECFQRAALRITNQEKDQEFFVQYGKRKENQKWLIAKRVSLARTSMSPSPKKPKGSKTLTRLKLHKSKSRERSPLPEKPKCSGMLTLLLHENELTEFPRQFFKHMCGLQVLSIGESRISGLPSSISSLTNLKGLFLDCRMLVQLPRRIGNLKNLEILVVRHSGICSLPSEIGQLEKLKCLRVSFREVANQNHGPALNNMIGNSSNNNHKGAEERIIPIGIIKKLSKLEELSIDVASDIRRWNKNANEIAEEIIELKELTHLHFYFPDMASFVRFIENSESWKANGEFQEFEGFRSFNIFVGEKGNSSASDFNVLECSAVKHLKFSAGDGFHEAVSSVLKQANSFELVGHTTARSLTENLPADTLRELEVCIVEDCNEMRSIIDSNTNGIGGEIFQFLKNLHMKRLPNLVSIWNGAIASESFRKLTTLTLKECQSIKMVFSKEVVRQFCELQNLQVEDCRMIEMVIDTEGTVDESLVLPRLKNFKLFGLTSLCCICDALVQWPSLEILQIKTCEALRSLPCNLESAFKLREIRCDEDWWRQLQWPNNELKSFSGMFVVFSE